MSFNRYLVAKTQDVGPLMLGEKSAQVPTEVRQFVIDAAAAVKTELCSVEVCGHLARQGDPHDQHSTLTVNVKPLYLEAP